MIFENFEFAGLEERNGVGELEVGGGVWRGRRQFLPAGGAYDVEADKLKGDGAAGWAAGAFVDESFGHAVGWGWIPDDFRGLSENMPSAQLPW